MTEYVTRGRHPADPTGELFGDTHWPIPNTWEGGEMISVAFDRETLTVIATGDYRVLWAKAIMKFAPARIVIGRVEAPTTYSCFTEMELKLLHKNLTGIMPPAQDYPTLIKAVQAAVREIEPLPTPSILRPNRPPAYEYTELPFGNKPVAREIPKPLPKATPKEITRPRAGTATGRVWDIADALADELGSWQGKDFRAKLIEKCSGEGINPATTQVQYSKWKGSRNLA